jgi:putative flippase GtrA
MEFLRKHRIIRYIVVGVAATALIATSVIPFLPPPA